MSRAEANRIVQQYVDKYSQRPRPILLDKNFMFDLMKVVIVVDILQKFWIKCEDLARALGIEDPKTAVCNDVDEKYTKPFGEISLSFLYKDLRVDRSTMFVNEIGMNMFIFNSNRSSSTKFLEWMYDVVLPAIRINNCISRNPDPNVDEALLEYLAHNNSELRARTFSLEITTMRLKDTRNKLRKMQFELTARDAQLKKLELQLKTMASKVCSMQLDGVSVMVNELKWEYMMLVRAPPPTTEKFQFPYYVLKEETLDESFAELHKKYPVVLLKLSTPKTESFFDRVCDKMRIMYSMLCPLEKRNPQVVKEMLTKAITQKS